MPGRTVYCCCIVAVAMGCAFESGGLGASSGGTDTAATTGGSTGTGIGGTSVGTSSGGASSGSTGAAATGGTTGGGSSSDSATTTGASGGPGTTSTGGGEIFEFPAVQDSFLNQAAPLATAGQDASLRVGSGSTADRATRALVQADLTTLPKCDIAFAELFLYYYADGEPAWALENTTINAYVVTGGWDAAVASWTAATTLEQWGVAGGDFDPTVVDSTLVAGGNFGWVSWNVTEAAKTWCTAPASNLGLILAQPADMVGSQGRKHFTASDDWANDPRHPTLRIILTP